MLFANIHSSFMTQCPQCWAEECSVSLILFTDQYGFFNYYKKWLCIKEKLGLDHFKVLEQFGIQNCLLLNKYNHTQFIQLPFFSFIYWGLDNKTDIIGRILKFTMETDAGVEGKRMYFWILQKLLDLAVSTRSVLEKKTAKWYPNYCLNG